ncbi:MAG: hypothetical protein GXO60_01045 [Epsilonproteobacteria bacterium]|nr:hypothetical protein [Campylobacterota bacterium]
MGILKFATTVALIAMLFSGCTKEVKKDVFVENNITRPELEPYQLNAIADQIFKNETGGNIKYIMYWSPSENFASLGYGHFIWYPANQPVVYDQTFPDMIQYYIDNKVDIPQWLKDQKDKGIPWANKQAFDGAKGTPKYEQLKIVLLNTKALQTKFFFDRVVDAIPEIVKYVPKEKRDYIKNNYNAVANSEGGWYPLIDYINFKGKGIKETEKYNNQGWGLLQVLQTMRPVQKGPQALKEFSNAAKVVLENRVKNKPSERHFLKGWLKRVSTYEKPIY